ncbi:hypothetical protein LTR36_010813 [Oleoguttula mirabilis]|uniref:DUF7514 domain-containing protein n=1 Tax=Oleoguttula mirabilis TaxID=1507867 RepID=A0AAV9JSX1_9PEZI|nr:hypothetical protein LTR36_010813 [Oleoguttula mirabilis]
MDGRRSPSPPLPPDPKPGLRKVQPFQEQFVVQSPSIPVQQDGPMGVKRSNTSRSRATSRAEPTMYQPQPISDAVNNAFDHSPVAQTQLDPELIRQVTEQVIRNLQTTAIAGATPTAPVQPQQTHFAPPPPAPAQPVTGSPTQSSTESIPHRYTPPSPGRRGKTDDVIYSSPSPEPLQSDQDSVYSKCSKTSNASTRSRETPRPAQMDGSGGLKRSDTTSGRRKDTASDEDMRRRRGSGSGSMASDQSRPFRRDSRGSESDHYEVPSSRSRARPPRILSDVAEATTLEKIWQPLFDNGNPTIRLSQFLRGLALHLIDDYQPKGSLVVTPAKMLRFFNEAKVPDECYPWDVIFGGKLSSLSLSKIYQKLLCQHHLVQTQNHETPTVPGLTPSGFEQLMTCLIQAHPDKEFERLAKAVMNMPISNADNKSERFPKELSRRLLPASGSLQAGQRIEASLNHEPILVQLRGVSSMPPPPPASAPPQQSSFTERERKPYAQTSFSNAIDDDDLLGQPSMPRERERKPYSSKEGMGKVYSGENERERDNRPPMSYRPEAPPKRRNSRSSSNVPTQATYSSIPSDPVNIPSQKSHRASVNQGPPPAMFNTGMNGMNGSMPKGGRRSPPPRNMFARSEPMDVGGTPSSEYSSNLHSGYPPGARDRYAGDSDEETGRRYHIRRPTDRSGTNGMSSSSNNNNNNNEDDYSGARSYPIPPRQPPSAQGYEPNYNTGPPIGSYPRAGFAADGRRSTWYGATNTGPTAAGSDGYGSFVPNGGTGYPPQQQPYGSSVQQH